MSRVTFSCYFFPFLLYVIMMLYVMSHFLRRTKSSDFKTSKRVDEEEEEHFILQDKLKADII